MHIGLNISIFDAKTSLEQSTTTPVSTTLSTTNETTISNEDSDNYNNNNTNNNNNTTSQSSRYSFSGKMLSSCSPSNALISSNNGIYVIRPCGAAIEATELQTGRYLIVPSTFEPQEKRYNLDFYILSSLGPTSSDYSIIKLR